jgi:hypothetical protein
MNHLNKLIIRIFFFGSLFWMFSMIPTWAGEGPSIHIDPVTYTFPPVSEGETLSHEFVVSNRGSADLEIKDVTHQ